MKKTLLLIPMAIVFATCQKGVLIKDISKEHIKVNTPVDHTITSSNSITFWWENLNGADKYVIQVVKPDFRNAAELVRDTSTTTNKLTLSLLPGTYQWRIRAENSGHESEYQVFNLKIDSSNILTNQLVVPKSPLTGHITNQKSILFSWNELAAADSYSVEITMNSAVISYTETGVTSYYFTFPTTTASTYTCSWRVKALNETSLSQFNQPQIFMIDLLAPPAPLLLVPSENALVRDTTTFVWQQATSDINQDSMYIFNDSLSTQPIRAVSITGTTVVLSQVSPAQPLPSGTSSATPTRYWWRIKSVDKAGNSSPFSTNRSFRLY